MPIVELAAEADRAAICELDALVQGDNHRSEFLTQTLFDNRVIIARDGLQALGFAIFHQRFFHHFFVAELQIHPDQVNEGIDAALLRHAERLCSSDRIFVSASEYDDDRQYLYRSLGYVRSGQVENVNNHSTEVVFVKFLVP
jgi:GNAT superfamily N-acetyltransferase